MALSERTRREALEKDLEVLRASESRLRAIIDMIPALAWCALPDGSKEFLNRRWHEYTGLSSAEACGSGWQVAVHADDLRRLLAQWQLIRESGIAGEIEARIRRFDGEYRWFLIRAVPGRDERGEVVRWYGSNTDIDDRKRTEDLLRQNESELRTITDAIPQSIVVLAPDGRTLHANRVALETADLEIEEVRAHGFLEKAFHPDDLETVRAERAQSLLRGVPFRIRGAHAAQRGAISLAPHSVQSNERQRGARHPLVCNWHGYRSAKEKAEKRLQNENFALREEIDRSSMFEEIVGSSESMRAVLKQVAKVAPSDSTVLILGETGTGKELLARELHRRSSRSARAFVRVNCAAIPQALIASELFGHEKGAFTGALQRRLGRFESAEGGTLFLDEVGDLPLETQIALLRVLQEREFERVGSNQPIPIDVRVIAATNRDLSAAIADKTFRQDLFYRLNVFPIVIPSLRQRVSDIPVLVEYFIERYARKAGKRIKRIDQSTLDLFKAYDWPGNIRELQNIVERAVILSDTETFFIDQGWLKRAPATLSAASIGRSALVEREVEMIEAALAECHGRISGPSGAAAKLNIPRQTLESKIRSLGIDRHGRSAVKARADGLRLPGK